MLERRLATLATVSLLSAPSLWAAAGPGRQADRGPDLGDRTLEVASEGESPLAAAYRQLWVEVAEGLLAWDDALERLAEIEAQHGDDLRELDRLAKAQLALLRQVAARQPAGLVPAVALHAAAYERHRADQRYLLAQRSRELALAAAGLAGDRAPAEVRAGLADALVLLAVDIERNRMYLPAREVLEHAARIDPRHVEAALLLAAEYERIGSYELADAQVQAALLVAPRHPEARLRRGTLLLRTRRAAEAELLLDQLVAEECEHWSCRVAPQELARAMMRRDAFVEAAAVLEQAAQRYPDEAGYALQRALALDRAGKPSEAAAVLRDLPRSDGPAARYFYTERPEADLAPVQERLARTREAAPAVLAGVFGLGNGGGT